MRSNSAFVGMLVVAALLGAASGRAEEPQYDVQFVILKAPRTAGRLKAEAITTGGALLACGRFAVEWNGHSLSANAGQLVVEGQPYAGVGGVAATAEPAVLSVLAAPRLRTALGTSAQLKTSTAEPAQYFERDTDGRFSLKVLPVTPELDVEVLLGRGKAPEAVTATLSYRFVSLGKRAPVSGVSLDVGAPEFHEASGHGTETPVRGGDWCLVSLGDNTLSSGLVLLMRASRAR